MPPPPSSSLSGLRPSSRDGRRIQLRCGGGGGDCPLAWPPETLRRRRRHCVNMVRMIVGLKANHTTDADGIPHFKFISWLEVFWVGRFDRIRRGERRRRTDSSPPRRSRVSVSFSARLIAPLGSFSISVLQFSANSEEVSMDRQWRGRTRMMDVEATLETLVALNVWISC